MTILLLAGPSAAHLPEDVSKSVAALSRMGGDIHLLVLGTAGAPGYEATTLPQGVSRVLIAESKGPGDMLAETVAALIVSLAPDYGVLAAPSGSLGKSVMPRVAALLDVMQVSDVVDIVGPDTFKRPIYAGNAIATVRSTDPIKVLTIRASAFPPAAPGGAAAVSTLPPSATSPLSQFVAADMSAQERPDLASARVIVSGGRAFGSKEQFDATIVPLADKLGAAIGASRAAVDAGYASSDLQVGQTGRIVAPELYIACGISGAIQHLAGITDARVIVAINKDADAPIFQVADYGLVGDVFTVLPELVDAL